MQYLDSTVAKIEAMNTEWGEKMVRGIGAFDVDQILGGLFGILCQVDKTILEQDLQDIKVRFVCGHGPEVVFGEHRYTASLLCHHIWVRTHLEPADCYALVRGVGLHAALHTSGKHPLPLLLGR